ncbi:YihA family ribosome biogenesis GTP-binding protein [Candidatus Sumerlaeota bacterium]|nr:YihA family ribosome biogenesis GTP-binding protein [Candidatus Sumerlaeota bacterium]
MKISSAEFVRGVTSARDFPRDDLPQIAFAGRSNVGKSSLINCLVRRKALARTSRTPGRTQEINLFRINGSMLFVDLPGFGYARVSPKMREAWGRLIEAYLRHAGALRAVVFLVDARHGPQANDLQLLDWLLAFEVPFIPVLTKADKVPKTRRTASVRMLEAKAPALGACEPILFSAQTGLGREALLGRIEGFVED